MTQYSGKVIRKTPVTPTQLSASGVWKLNEQAAAIRNNSWPIAGVPDPISRSVRLRNSATAYFKNQNQSSGGDSLKYTISCWIKRGSLGGTQLITSAFTSPDNFGSMTLFLDSNGALGFGSYFLAWRITTAVFRDPSAWYHIVAVWDSANATAANRVRLYVNNVEQTSFSTNNTPAQSYGNPYCANDNGSGWGSQNIIGATRAIGASAWYQLQTFDGYITEFNCVQGQALTPSSFGTTDPTSGAWIPMAYTGTYGTNGFYVNFKDNTSTTTLGYDYSGNAIPNNWTPVNISLTAGSTYDSMLDVPTPWVGYSTTTDTSAVTRGNYAVLNGVQSNSTGQLSQGNLSITGANAYKTAYSTMTFPSTGKWYWEGVFVQANNNLGFGCASIGPNTPPNPLANTNGIGITSNGFWYLDTSTGTSGHTGWSVSTVVGMLWDSSTNTFSYTVDGTNYNTVGSVSTTDGRQWCPACWAYATNDQVALNFGQRPFTYTPPTGSKTLVTTNLPTPTITNGANYMAASTWTGNGSSTVTVANGGNNTLGLTFQPDFVWAKRRDTTNNHQFYDAVRGAGYWLGSNSTSAEVFGTSNSFGYLNAFTSTGFSATAGTSDTTNFNANGGTYVAWQWKANGAGSSNTSGSITSTVSVNTTAGFSVATYTGTSTGNGDNKTVGHGLGVAPKFVIVKARTGGAENWYCWHTGLTSGTYYVVLNSTAAQTNDNTRFYQAPSSSLLYLGGNTGVSATGYTYVAYCWSEVAGYSAFGSYTGNGSTDGPFVYCGFRPRWVMIKRTDASSDWVILDTSRNTYNVVNNTLWADLSSAESTAYSWLDILSNGFKFRDSANGLNNSGATYIYAAFAENPFKYSNAR